MSNRIIFTLGDPPRVINFDNFKHWPDCNSEKPFVTYTGSLPSGVPLPDFVKFDGLYRNFTVTDTGNLKAPKKYSLVITGKTLGDTVLATQMLQLILAKDYA